MDYAMVCRPRPYPSVVCFETIEGNESGIIARNVPPSTGVEKQNQESSKGKRKLWQEGTSNVPISMQHTSEEMAPEALASRSMDKLLNGVKFRFSGRD
jgi:hypothetical protein